MIKLQVYLKRTEQTMEQWLRDNEITDPSDLLPRCAYLGLAADASDVALAEQALKALTPPSPEAAPISSEEKKGRKKKQDVTATSD